MMNAVTCVGFPFRFRLKVIAVWALYVSVHPPNLNFLVVYSSAGGSRPAAFILWYSTSLVSTSITQWRLPVSMMTCPYCSGPEYQISSGLSSSSSGAPSSPLFGPPGNCLFPPGNLPCPPGNCGLWFLSCQPPWWLL